MKFRYISYNLAVLIIGILILAGCYRNSYDNFPGVGREPLIVPDYSGVTIPYNIAPLNFFITEEARLYKITATSSNNTKLSFRSSNGIIRFPLKSWKKLLSDSRNDKIKIQIFAESKGGEVKKYDPVYIYIAKEPIDPYLCYRLLYPGYESWSEMKIVQRSIENFKESSLIENQLLEDNCVNCHTFNQKNPGRFLLHVRGSMAGTYFVENGEVIRRELRTPNMQENAVYPSWHPTGKYVIFSSNKIVQNIHMRPERNNEFYDIHSRLVLFNIEKNEMREVENGDSINYMETNPFWSPRGNYVYYCRTLQVKTGFDYRKIKYDLVRKSFNQEKGIFGKTEIVLKSDTIKKSVSLPVISPDGRYVVFVLHDYGTFPVWHKEADLYILDLEKGKIERMPINSSETESYPSWSSNGKWLCFSSKRGDRLTSRPYFAYFGSTDTIGKPFVLPQKDPLYYESFEKTFNRPEFITGKISTGPRDFARASKKEAEKANWIDNRNRVK